MSYPQAKLLIVDDEVPIRLALSAILDELGYSVRTAADGFSALAEIRRDIPDVIVSDLNMPGMSGFELLSVVRRRFPAVHVIAMSGSYSGDNVPPGVAADAFYEKGTHPGLLFRIVKAMTQPERLPSPVRPSLTAPVWIPRNGHDDAGEPYVMVTCTECLRTFPQVLGKNPETIHDANCVYCSSPIQYAIVQPEGAVLPEAFLRKPRAGSPTPPGLPNLLLLKRHRAASLTPRRQSASPAVPRSASPAQTSPDPGRIHRSAPLPARGKPGLPCPLIREHDPRAAPAA
jgi:CheY-like chemotaxis protein